MIPLFRVRMATDASERVSAVLNSGYIGQGPQVELFEQALAERLRHPAPLTVNSATSALTLAMRICADHCPDRREVLAPPLTCTATNWPILALGRRIRWVDTDPSDGGMDLDDLQRKISGDTLAIMLVHWGGYPHDLDRVSALADDCARRFGHRPFIIEDAAHAMGSTYKGRPLGLHGNLCIYSLQAIKHLTAGDGGVLLCPDEQTTELCRLLRWYGIDRRNSDNFRCAEDIAQWGYKFHMNDINATIGLANLELLEDTITQHQANAAYYRQNLQDVAGLKLLEEKPDRSSAAWLFTLRVQNRDALQQKLNEHGIESGRVHERNDRYTCTREFQLEELPGTDVMTREMLCIPVGWWVTEEQRAEIVNVIRAGW